MDVFRGVFAAVAAMPFIATFLAAGVSLMVAVVNVIRTALPTGFTSVKRLHGFGASLT